MQLVLRMERADPPSWHRALAAAATGAAALCVDPRSEPGGEWYDAIRDYCRGHIRKVTRRARGAHWVAAQELPGITIEIDGTQVRALLPGLVSELDPRISRLQVGGTDVAPDEPPVVSPDEAGAALRVWLAPTPVMTLGKAMAQAGHAGMIAVALLAEANPDVLGEWTAAGLAGGCPAGDRRGVVRADGAVGRSRRVRRDRDAGRAGRRVHRSRSGHHHRDCPGAGIRRLSAGRLAIPAPARAPRTDAATRCRPVPGESRCRSAHPAHRTGPVRPAASPGTAATAR